jgi:hypothetical protein
MSSLAVILPDLCCSFRVHRMTEAQRISFETSVMKLTPTQVTLLHSNNLHFAETCRLTVRDTNREDVRDHIVNALWNAMFN